MAHLPGSGGICVGMVAEWGFMCWDGGGVGVYVLGWWQSGGLSVGMVSEWGFKCCDGGGVGV